MYLPLASELHHIGNRIIVQVSGCTRFLIGLRSCSFSSHSCHSLQSMLCGRQRPDSRDLAKVRTFEPMAPYKVLYLSDLGVEKKEEAGDLVLIWIISLAMELRLHFHRCIMSLGSKETYVQNIFPSQQRHFCFLFLLSRLRGRCSKNHVTMMPS